ETRPFAAKMLALPKCLVVHQRNYLAIRIKRNRNPIYLLIDFSRANPPSPGMGTAYFMNVYDILLRNRLKKENVFWDWFVKRFTIVPPEAKKWLTNDGILHNGTELPGQAPQS